MTRDKLISIAKGAGIAGLGAALTYLLAYVSSSAGSADLGIYGPAVAATLAVLVNIARKLVPQAKPNDSVAAADLAALVEVSRELIAWEKSES